MIRFYVAVYKAMTSCFFEIKLWISFQWWITFSRCEQPQSCYSFHTNAVFTHCAVKTCSCAQLCSLCCSEWQIFAETSGCTRRATERHCRQMGSSSAGFLLQSRRAVRTTYPSKPTHPALKVLAQLQSLPVSGTTLSNCLTAQDLL